MELSSRETRRKITKKLLLFCMKNIMCMSDLYIRCVGIYLADIFLDLLRRYSEFWTASPPSALLISHKTC